MQNKLTIDKSLIFQYKGNQVLVDSLPDILKYEIFTLDKLRQDRIDAAYELEKHELAVQAKVIHLNKLLQDHYGETSNGEETAQKIDTAK